MVSDMKWANWTGECLMKSCTFEIGGVIVDSWKRDTTNYIIYDITKLTSNQFSQHAYIDLCDQNFESLLEWMLHCNRVQKLDTSDVDWSIAENDLECLMWLHENTDICNWKTIRCFPYIWLNGISGVLRYSWDNNAPVDAMIPDRIKSTPMEIESLRQVLNHSDKRFMLVRNGNKIDINRNTHDKNSVSNFITSRNHAINSILADKFDFWIKMAVDISGKLLENCRI
jgi:hypothetical protein